MSGRAFYNENNKQAADWLRELMHEQLIPPGVVDERSIGDVSADDLRGFDQVHFCAGIGVWPYALRCAGWEDDRPVGTGSFPCQPFSAAGKGAGFADPRHIWPDGHRIIRDARQQGQRWTDCFFGEQAPTAGAWIDLVRSDLEAIGYAFGSPDLPAAGFGGAHIRQRFYWVADAHNAERWADHAPRHVGDWPSAGRVQGPGDLAERSPLSWLANAYGRHASAERQQRGGEHGQQPQDGSAGWVVHTESISGRSGLREGGALIHRVKPSDPSTNDPDWLLCADGLLRPVEAGTFPLAHEAPARLGRLRGYGNALDAEVATNFVGAFMDAAGINSRLRIAA